MRDPCVCCSGAGVWDVDCHATVQEKQKEQIRKLETLLTDLGLYSCNHADSNKIADREARSQYEIVFNSCMHVCVHV